MAVQFDNAAQAECHRRAGEDLRAAFGDLVRDEPGQPAYFVAFGEIGARVEVRGVGDDDAAIEVYSWIAQGLPVNAEVGLYLARHTIGLGFGALGIDDEDAIILQHSLFSDGANGAVLPRLVAVIASTAETLDEELRERFGG